MRSQSPAAAFETDGERLPISFGLSTFMPVIIKGLGFSAIKTQLITAPIYFWAAGVYIAVAAASDRVQKRSIFMVPMACVTLAGYAILVSPVSALPARIIGVLLAATGIYCIVGLVRPRVLSERR